LIRLAPVFAALLAAKAARRLGREHSTFLLPLTGPPPAVWDLG
jgi:hypothetical protein